MKQQIWMFNFDIPLCKIPEFKVSNERDLKRRKNSGKVKDGTERIKVAIEREKPKGSKPLTLLEVSSKPAAAI